MLSENNKNRTLIFDTVIPLCFDLRKCWDLSEKNIVAKLKLMERTHEGFSRKLRHLLSFLENETYVPRQTTKIKQDSHIATTLATVSMLKLENMALTKL